MAGDRYVGGCRTVEFSVVIMVACWLLSLPRTLSQPSAEA
jgi:hypothetical protein